MTTHTYDVFTRQRPGDDLLLVGSVDAPNDQLASINARTLYDEEDWDRMMIVREKDEIEVRAPPVEAAADAAEVSR